MKEKTPLMIVVLGMHRSGTSLITSILSKAGFYIGEEADLMKGTRWNRDGYFERWSVVELNNIILDLCDGSWDSPPDEKDIIKIKIDPKIKSLLKVYLDHDKSVIKDPRMCITFPVWQKVLGENVRIINVIREPHAVALSLMRRDKIPLQKGIDLLHIYTERVSKYSKNYPVYSLRYEDLFSDRRKEILKGLSDFLGINTELEEIAKQVINPDLNHYKSDTDYKAHPAASVTTILPHKLRKSASFIQKNRRKYKKAIRFVHKYKKYKATLKAVTKNDVIIALGTSAKVNYYFTKYIVRNITRPFRRLLRKFNRHIQ